MSTDTDTTGPSSLLSSITRLLDTGIAAGAGFDNIITVISLLCLLSIMNRNQAGREAQPKPAVPVSPLHKLLGELTKGGDGSGGLSPDTLLTLLPLLNSPQLKSKLNPGTIGTVMGLLNNLGGLGSGSPPPEKAETENKAKPDSPAAKAPKQTPAEDSPPAAARQPSEQPQPALQSEEPLEETAEKNYGRYLNWKNNF